MQDFDIAKYLRENYEGPFKTFQPLVNLPALKEESEEQLDSTVPYEGPDPHLDGLGSSFDQVAPVEEKITDLKFKVDLPSFGGISSQMKKFLNDKNIVAKDISVDFQEEYEFSAPTKEALQQLIMKFYAPGMQWDQEDINTAFNDIQPITPVEESDIQEVHTASKVFDLSDPESSEDALEWIYDNTDFEPETEDEDYELRHAQIEDIIGYVNEKISGHEIDYNMTDDDTIELTIKPTGATMKEDAYGPDTEQGQFDRMMGLINTSLEPQLPMLKKAVDKARQVGFNDKQIFGMLQTSPITGQSVKDLVDDGFDGQEIVDFFATDFSQNEEVTVSSSGVEMEEDTDNVTAADNAAYGADQEIGEPI